LLSILVLIQMVLPYQADPVRITVSMENPTQHYYQIEIMFPARDLTRREISMPAWTPGSYKIRDHARHVEEFSAMDLSNTPLPWQKLDKSVWEIQTVANQPFKIIYRLFSFEFTVRTNYLDSFYGYLNPASAFFYERDQMNAPHRVRVVPFANWIAAVPLPKEGAQTYLADNWHQLVDSPMMFGPLRIHEFQVRDIVHRWVIAGETNMDENAGIEALKKIAEVCGEMFGSYPFNRYFFLSAFQLGSGGGGLEHRNNTLVAFDGLNLRNAKGWDRFLGLMIHEYFHAWNVHAIRDEALIAQDYQNETYTKLLWVHEGWTSYYDNQLMARAGFWKPKKLLSTWAEEIGKYRQTPGASQQSLIDASFNAWIHQYQASPARENSQISYYSAGALSGLALDLFLRHQTRNKVSLDDVLVQLYTAYAQEGEGVSLEKIMAVLEEKVGFTATQFVLEYILKPNPLPFEQVLGYAGLSLEEKPEKKPEDKLPFELNPEVSLGIRTESREGRIYVRSVLRDGNGWQAGLDFGDEILAINRRRVTQATFEKILAWSRPGDDVALLVSRGNTVLEIQLRLAAEPKKLMIKKVESPTELQMAIFASVFNPLGVEEKEAEEPKEASHQD